MRGERDRRRIELQGLVQGVGLRPLVYNLARRLRLGGWVSNNGDGALIEVEGEKKKLLRFRRELNTSLSGIIGAWEWREERVVPRGEESFNIRSSLLPERPLEINCPDASLCRQCRREFKDPNNRRYRYPFIGCPVCGPRFTLLLGLPYDRERSAMASFEMCRSCQAEYNDPADRRFHSQLNCCPECGPRLQLWRGGELLRDCDPLEEVVRLLKGGNIVALKGLGGFHLAADASSPRAVARLRERKKRPHKPLAVLCSDLRKIEKICEVEKKATRLLQSPAAPIVLLPGRPSRAIAGNIAPGLDRLGVMLPYTALHYILSEPFDALALTSGNLSEEPIIRDNEEALKKLAPLADGILLHDRCIRQRCDDSVLNPLPAPSLMIRRSRGYGPSPVSFHRPLPDILACGGEQKNTFALSGRDKIVISQHLGDLKSASAFKAYRESIEHYRSLLRCRFRLAAHDLHPDYLTTRYALDSGLPARGVQHHHAHVAAVMAEHGLDRPVIGVAWDGSGFGEDGKIWGGEFLIAHYGGYRRAAHFDYLPLPGAEAAIRQPWRTAMSLLYRINRERAPGVARRIWPHKGIKEIGLVWTMVERGLNCPLSSGCGRIFDGVAALLGLAAEVSYEGQGAALLQNLAQKSRDEGAYGVCLSPRRGKWVISSTALAEACLGELERDVPPAVIARRFHNTLAQTIIHVCSLIREERGIREVVLGGGVFQNDLLCSLALRGLEKAGFEAYLPRRFPPNDGALSLGQLAVAAVCAVESEGCTTGAKGGFF